MFNKKEIALIFIVLIIATTSASPTFEMEFDDSDIYLKTRRIPVLKIGYTFFSQFIYKNI